MNNTKKLISMLFAGAALGVTAPVFADSWHGSDRDYRASHSRHDYRDHRDYRDHGRYIREVERRHVVVVQRPYVVEQPVAVYYAQPAPQPNIGLGQLIGAAIGGIYDSRQ